MVDARLTDAKSSFSAFSHLLDSRILRALADMGFSRPTLVQMKAIPIALENRDILARACTGSGKTMAYCIPVLQKILTTKATLSTADPSYRVTRALILVPTRELSEQVHSCFRSLLAYCDKEVAISNVASGAASHVQRALLTDKPDIVVATPSRALGLLQSKTLALSSLESLVIDEADLILSYGHDEDMRQFFGGGHLPNIYQSFLMSATMTDDVETLKGLALRNPAILKLEDGDEDEPLLTQYFVRCTEIDKFLLTYVILKLHLIKGKCILFVNDVDRCYRLKLFLEQFSIKCCVLNSELPLNSRYHTVQEFNRGVYDYIIATDGSSGKFEKDSDNEPEVEEGPQGSASVLADGERPGLALISKSSVPDTTSQKRRRSVSPQAKPSKSHKRKKKKTSDREYGVTRGVDFVDVACVVNFDLPTSLRSYTHRVGRTARAGRTGMSLSFVVPSEEWGRNKVVGCLESSKNDEVVLAKIEKEQTARGNPIKEYQFDMQQVEAFRYRMEDALRSVTRSAIKEARIKELKAEILNSEKLKAHFEDNPLDLEYLRHDKPLHPTRIQTHMKHVPKYLLPRMGLVAGTQEEDFTTSHSSMPKVGFVPFKKSSGGRRGRGGRGRGGSNGGSRKKSDPLKIFR